MRRRPEAAAAAAFLFLSPFLPAMADGMSLAPSARATIPSGPGSAAAMPPSLAAAAATGGEARKGKGGLTDVRLGGSKLPRLYRGGRLSMRPPPLSSTAAAAAAAGLGLGLGLGDPIAAFGFGGQGAVGLFDRQPSQPSSPEASLSPASAAGLSVLVLAAAAVAEAALGHPVLPGGASLVRPLADVAVTALTLLRSLPLVSTLLTVPFWSGLAPFASIALKLSPMPTMAKIRKQKSTGGLPLLPYSAITTLTFVLVIYGILVRDPRIMITHGIGHLISLTYLATFYSYCDRDGTSYPGTVGLHLRTGLGVMAFVLGSCLLLGREAAASVAGLTTVVLSCLMYAGPLSALRGAVRRRSADDVPLPYAVASFVNAIAWTVYGFYGRNGDVMVWAPGCLGVWSALAQIAVNIRYGRRSRRS